MDTVQFEREDLRNIVDFYYVPIKTTKTSDSLRHIILPTKIYGIITVNNIHILITNTKTEYNLLTKRLSYIFDLQDNFILRDADKNILNEGYSTEHCIETIMEYEKSLELYTHTLAEKITDEIKARELKLAQSSLDSLRCYDMTDNEESIIQTRTIKRKRYDPYEFYYKVYYLLKGKEKNLTYFIDIIIQNTILERINYENILIALNQWRICLIDLFVHYLSIFLDDEINVIRLQLGILKEIYSEHEQYDDISYIEQQNIIDKCSHNQRDIYSKTMISNKYRGIYGETIINKQRDIYSKQLIDDKWKELSRFMNGMLNKVGYENFFNSQIKHKCSYVKHSPERSSYNYCYCRIVIGKSNCKIDMDHISQFILQYLRKIEDTFAPLYKDSIILILLNRHNPQSPLSMIPHDIYKIIISIILQS